MTRPLCIYHANCSDGFATATVVHKYFNGEVDFHPGVYQETPPDVTGRDVIIVDFSYKRQVLNEMGKSARSILILDHHKTAAEDLNGFSTPRATWQDHLEEPNIYALFDMHRSGARLTWDYFYPDRVNLPFIQYVEDRDLWLKRLPDCDVFAMALNSYPYDFVIWVRLLEQDPKILIDEGRHIYRYFRKVVDSLKQHPREGRFVINNTPIFGQFLNVPTLFSSEVAGEIARDGQFGCCYQIGGDGKTYYSLRSRGDLDVSVIAMRFGGGGHKNAAGFTWNGLAHEWRG